MVRAVPTAKGRPLYPRAALLYLVIQDPVILRVVNRNVYHVHAWLAVGRLQRLT